MTSKLRPAGDAGSADHDTERDVRERLAAHPWPRFGPSLAERLHALPTAITAEAGREVAPAASGRRDTRQPAGLRRRRTAADGWANAVLVVLLLAAGGLAWRTVGQGPAEHPPGTPDPMASSPPPPKGLGRLVYWRQAVGGASPGVAAVDLSTGEDRFLFELPTSGELITSAWSHFALSPDGGRLAFARGPASEGGGLIDVRQLAEGSPLAGASLGPDWVNGLVWSPEGNAIYYGQTFGQGDAEPQPGAVTGFEISRLELVDGVDAGPSRTLARLESADLDGGLPRLLGVCESGWGAAVMVDQKPDDASTTIILLELHGGHEVDRTVVPASDVLWSYSPELCTLAYVESETISDAEAPGTYRGNLSLLTLATGEIERIASLFDGPPQNLLWSRDGRFLAWTIDKWAVAADDAKGTGTQSMPVSWGEALNPDRRVMGNPGAGRAVAFAPTGEVLLTGNGGLGDRAGDDPSPAVLPALPPEAVDHPLGWVPVSPPTMASPTATYDPDLDDPDHAPIQLTPVATVLALPSSADVSAGPDLDVVGWSADGQWLAYWTADGADHYEFWKWPGTLHLLNAETGEGCVQPEVRRTTHSDDVFWTDDGQVTVRTEGRVVKGEPCGALAPAPESTYALPPAAAPGETPTWAEPPPHEGGDSPGPEDTIASRDGAYFATTSIASEKDDEDRYTTRIARVSDRTVVAEATWQGNGGLGDMGTGGQWLPSGAFLISYSVDRGPLLIDPNGTVSEVAPEIFGVPLSANEVSNGDSLMAALVLSPGGETWHMFLEGGNRSAMLYHPESGKVETLPSKRTWNPPISPDGRWLILVGHFGGGFREGALWVRPLEDELAELRPLRGGGHWVSSHAKASADWSHLALVDPGPGTVDIVDFPWSNEVRRWLTEYRLDSMWWSPDGRFLAIEGHHGAGTTVERALFLIHVRLR